MPLFTLGLCMFSVPIALAQDFCKGDFNYDGSVASDDVQTFLELILGEIYTITLVRQTALPQWRRRGRLTHGLLVTMEIWKGELHCLIPGLLIMGMVR